MPAPPDESRDAAPDASAQASARSPDNGHPAPSGQETIYLHGFVPLNDFLRFMASDAATDEQRDPRSLAERWREANDVRQALERAEADWVNRLAPEPGPDELAPLPAELAPLVAGVRADPIFQRAFSAVPTRIALVELDKLIVYQRTINLDHVRRLKARLGAPPTPDALFRFCLPTDHPAAPFRVRPVKDNSFIFLSESRDMRFLEPIVLDAGQSEAAGYQALGPVAGVIGMVVGFGSNFLNVIASAQRLVLNNGYHRAYALRELGITHVPALVQEVRTRDELKVVAGARLRNHPDRYLKSLRPPRLADFFHPKLAMRLRVVPKLKQVRVSFTVEEFSL